ncbi:MAG: oxygen-independent coproporphyrinogen III oxidase [Proteobacteria bacterium]|nr:oxygen-independent coproporphyrinogen III oxidase [Pseudomonadota bacterium]
MVDQHELLKIEHLARKYSEVNIPLYLSYPTSNFWENLVDEEMFVNTHRNYCAPFIYFHFPYCEKACYYCMCYKSVASDPRHNDVYITYLEKEFLNTLGRLGHDALNQVRHIHWGGGTPTYLTCDQIEKIHQKIFGKIKLVDHRAASKSIEAYPDEKILTNEKLKLLFDLGFNEISLGIQDFDERIQKTINRNCGRENVFRIVSNAKALGFRVHVDLCYGLPFQGQNELEKTIREVLRMDPDRVALFTYAHYPNIFPLQRKIPSSSIPNSFIRVLLAMLAEEMFSDHGFRKVGYDHYVKANDPLCKAAEKKQVIRDFMGYSVHEKREFMGFGNAAISYLGDGFYHNIQSLKKYYKAVDDNRIPLEKNLSHMLTREDRIRNKVIQKSILSDFNVHKEDIAKEFAISFDDHFRFELKDLIQLENDGLVDMRDPHMIRVTRAGEYFVRHIAHVFDNYYNRRESLN